MVLFSCHSYRMAVGGFLADKSSQANQTHAINPFLLDLGQSRSHMGEQNGLGGSDCQMKDNVEAFGA